MTTRLPGRIDPGQMAFGSADDLAGALRRAEAAYAAQGPREVARPDWYAAYLAAEQTGESLPS